MFKEKIEAFCNSLGLDTIGFTKCRKFEELREFYTYRKENNLENEFEEKDIEKRINPNLYLKEGRNLLLDGVKSDYLIVGKKSEKLTTRRVEQIIDDIIKRTSIKLNITPHMFRHTFATHLLDNGCDLLVVQELLGHASLSSTEIYTHVSNEHLREVYLKCHPRNKR